MTVDALGLLALALLFAALIAAFGAVTSRSLFATGMYLAAAAAAVSTMVLLLGAGNGALAVVLVAAGWTPVLLLAAMLLSARATKDSRGIPWVGLVIGAAALLAMWWPLHELAARSVAQAQATPVQIAFWLAPLLLAAVAGVVAVLGYGERGALGAGDGG